LSKAQTPAIWGDAALVPLITAHPSSEAVPSFADKKVSIKSPGSTGNMI
jgi:hypothetical protein